MKFADLLLDVPVIKTCCVPNITDGTTKLVHFQEHIKNQKQIPILLAMPSRESVLLDERYKILYIARMVFFTLFPTEAVLFNNFREILVQLPDYYLHLMQYWDNWFACYLLFRFWALNI